MLEYMSRERCFRAGCLALAGCIAIFLLRRPAWSLPATERHPHSLDDTNVFFRVYDFFFDNFGKSKSFKCTESKRVCYYQNGFSSPFFGMNHI